MHTKPLVTRLAAAIGALFALSAIAELATGIALVVVPARVVGLLLDPALSDSVVPVARIAGIALFALGLACWPGRSGSTAAAWRALLAYNLLVATYLAASAGSLDGVLQLVLAVRGAELEPPDDFDDLGMQPGHTGRATCVLAKCTKLFGTAACTSEASAVNQITSARVIDRIPNHFAV